MEEKKLADLFKRISFRNGNMIAAGYNSISFRIDNFPEGLPKDLHFTLAYAEERGELNLHVTRNFRGMDPDNKPKNDIAVFTLDGLNATAECMGIQLLTTMLAPVVFIKSGRQPKYGRKGQNGLVDLSKAEEWSSYREGDFLTTAKKYFKQKDGKGKFEMKPSFKRGIQKWGRKNFDSDRLRQAMKPLNGIDPGTGKLLLLKSDNYQGLVIFMEGRLFAIRQDVSLTAFFEAILGKEVTILLTAKVLKAIAIVSTAKTFKEIAHLNNPIRLFDRQAAAC